MVSPFRLIGPILLLFKSPSSSFVAVQQHQPSKRPRMSDTSLRQSSAPLASSLERYQRRRPISNENIFFIEVGFGNDSHGQSSTKAAVRACRNSIEFNSIPSIGRLIPDGGYDKLKLDVLLAVPPKYREGLDLDAVAEVFPYGDVRFEIQDGGMVAPSGIAIESMGDGNDDMVIVCASVTVGR